MKKTQLQVHGGEVVTDSNYSMARRRRRLSGRGDTVVGVENCSNRCRPCASRTVSQDKRVLP